VEIDPASRKVRIRRIVQAWESGAIVNPDGLRNQTSGAIVQAIGGALFEKILFADGRIQNPRFAQYRVPRFSDTPEIEVILIDRKDLPSAGAGETGIVGLAPAVANAIFAATGVRLPRMPMAPRDSTTGEGNSHFLS
jgi:isoquinoline 1-oxidoreductase